MISNQDLLVLIKERKQELSKESRQEKEKDMVAQQKEMDDDVRRVIENLDQIICGNLDFGAKHGFIPLLKLARDADRAKSLLKNPSIQRLKQLLETRGFVIKVRVYNGRHIRIPVLDKRPKNANRERPNFDWFLAIVL